LICATVLVGFGQAHAPVDEDDYGFFNHVSFSVSGGTTGIGFELAAPMTANFAVRAGYSFMPKIKYSQKLTLDKGDLAAFYVNGHYVHEVDLEGKLNMGDFSLMFDWYPWKNSSFRITAGAYIGKSDVVTVTNKEPFMNPEYAGKAGIDLSRTGSNIMEKYTIVTDAAGNVDAKLKVNGFKPYIGIGFGRAVPRKSIGLQFDLGVQFWGKPELQTNLMYYDGEQGDFVTRYEKIEKGRITRSNEDKDYKDLRDAVKTIEAISVYPVLTLRFVGRIF
jgi:hypothetical protein